MSEAAAEFLRGLDADWARVLERLGPADAAPPAPDREPYEVLIRAVAAQKIAVKAAEVLIERLRALSPAAAFPSPEAICAMEFEALRGCGFSAAKIAALREIAAGAASGLVPTRAGAAELEDEALISRLTALRGVGRWTVEILLIRGLGRPDVLPAGDLALREGYRRLKTLSERPEPARLRRIGEAWAPHRSAASNLLWRLSRERLESLSRKS